MSIPWVNILPKNPYLAKCQFLKNLILLKSKNDDFWENLPNCWKKVSNVKINEEIGPFTRKMPNFKWILSKKHGEMAIFCALCANKILILLNLAQKSLSCNPPPPLGHSEEYLPMVNPCNFSTLNTTYKESIDAFHKSLMVSFHPSDIDRKITS